MEDFTKDPKTVDSKRIKEKIMRFIFTPTLLITLTIVLAPLAPRFAAAAGTDFVSVLEINGVRCYLNLNPIGSQMTPDANDEVQAGMAVAGGNDNFFFRGIMRLDKVDVVGIGICARTSP